MVSIEGTAAGSTLATFGRTAPLELPAAWDDGGDTHSLPIAYGPPDTFCTTAALRYARRDHRATLLADGSVLLSGGVDSAGDGVTALERYLPSGDDRAPFAAFVPVEANGVLAQIPSRAVRGHDATLLPDGRVLLTGGAPATTAEGDNAFEGALLLAADGTPSGPPVVLGGGPRAYHAGTLLPDGRVLVSGGCAIVAGVEGACASGQTLASTALYDPSTDVWADGPALLFARAAHRALVRGDGLVVIVGGIGEGGLAPPPELFDPDEVRGIAISGPSGNAVMLDSGLFVALGDAAGPSARPVAWSGADDAPVALPQLAEARAGATLTALEDGSVLVAGGRAGGALVATSAIVTTGGPVTSLTGLVAEGHAATRLRDGSVLITGGANASGSASTQAAIFLRSLDGPFASPATITFDDAGALISSRPSGAQVIGGALIVTGTTPAGDTHVPADFALLPGPTFAGPSAAGFDLTVLAGADAGAEAVVLFGDPAHARYVALAFAANAAPRLVSVTGDRPGLPNVALVDGCDAMTLAPDELPSNTVAPFTLNARGGRLELSAGARVVFRCDVDARVPARGAIALGALGGAVRWDNLAIVR